MDHGQKCVKGSIQVLLRDRGQDNAANAGSRVVMRGREGAAAVDGDFVAAGSQASRKLFGERLESAVARGNVTRSENGDLHRLGDRFCQRISQVGNYVWI